MTRLSETTYFGITYRGKSMLKNLWNMDRSHKFPKFMGPTDKQAIYTKPQNINQKSIETYTIANMFMQSASSPAEPFDQIHNADDHHNKKDKTTPSFTATSPSPNVSISQSSLVITQAQWSFARSKMGPMLKRERAQKQQWKQQSTCCFFISLRSQNKCHAQRLQIRQHCHISWDKGM